MPSFWTCCASGPSTSVPTRVGTPTAFTASSIRRYAAGSVNGSRSDEFSGQITTSGRSVRPAAMSAASFSVAAAWLLSTCIGRPRKSMPGLGTLPWMTATLTLSSPFVGTGTA